MDMKNTAILFILLLSILGLILGIHYSGDSTSDVSDFNKTGNGSTAISHNNHTHESYLGPFFNKTQNMISNIF